MIIFDDVLRVFTDVIYNGCLPSKMHDLLAGELIKARLMKASNRFDEALDVINSTLRRKPNHPEALFLKAQVLCEGFADYTAAAVCLRKVVLMKPLKKNEIIRRWSKYLLKEIAQQQRMQNSMRG